ncbi:DUF2306 domain-containing protein [Actinocorallia sp. API 0066]|uniref:DUF2306 domain-containing protein n=1 Tax=Actinocorallia sp. API 0066 TaxID=2896846 RepID=UPI001E46ED38|nr:DUF2306 domain-containing protein [Actinocorallia sp. API 0066]MCD0449558.1 DUF2306 domain-containing protein [Actinocorallia sp. API 0066]
MTTTQNQPGDGRSRRSRGREAAVFRAHQTQPGSRAARRAGGWWLALSAVAIALLAPLPYLLSSLDSLAADDHGTAAHVAGRPMAVQAAFYVHIVCGGLALLLSPLQLSSRLRARRTGAHRGVGRVVLIAILLAGAAGLVIAPYNGAGAVGVAGFGLLGLAWLACAVAAFRAIRRRDVPAHRRWAIRLFALTYAGVMLRVWTPLLIMAQVGVAEELAFDRAYTAVTFLCWVPNLIVAELYLRRGRRQTRR